MARKKSKRSKRKNPKRVRAAKAAWKNRKRSTRKRKNPKRVAAAKKAWKSRGRRKAGGHRRKRSVSLKSLHALRVYNAKRRGQRLSRAEIIAARINRKLAKKRARGQIPTFRPSTVYAPVTTPYLARLRAKFEARKQAAHVPSAEHVAMAL